MAPVIESKLAEVARLCREHHVRRLDLFGSAASGGFDPDRSDLDFLVEFEPTAALGPADQYFGLLFALEQLFGRKVDLVCATAMRNPYFIANVNQSRVQLYAA